MALTITLQGMGAFGATVGQPAYSFTAQLATPGPKGDKGADGATGPQGPAGTSGVAYATAPLYYDSGTKTVSISTTPTFSTVEATSLKANNGSQLLQIFGDHIYFPDDTSQTTAGLSPAAAASTYLTITSASATYQTQAAMSAYYLASNPSGYITSAALTGYATESWVGSQGYITSSALSPYLLSSTAASTYQTQAAMSDYLSKAGNLSGLASTSTARSNLGLGTMAVETATDYAKLASPALTGTPTAPTAAAGNNTTALATTAFVQQEVPAASTSAAGKVQLATNAQALTGTSTTLAMNPDDVRYVLTYGGYFPQPIHTYSVTSTSGTGASSYRLGNGWFLSAPTSATGSAVGAMTLTNPRRGAVYNGQINYSLPLAFSARLSQASTGTIDTNSVFRIALSKYTPFSVGDIVAANNAIMLKIAGGGALQLLVANGTTLTTVTSSYTPSNQSAFDVLVTSDGSGNVTVFVNGSSVATTSAGPTGSGTGAGNQTFSTEVENTTSLTNTRTQYAISSAFVYTAA